MKTLILDNFVVRDDAHGYYLAAEPGSKAQARTAKHGLTALDISKHLAGERIVGVHSTNADNQAKWLAVDFDTSTEAKQQALIGDTAPRVLEKQDLFKHALAARAKLKGLGLKTLLEDSTGGYHVWAFLPRPYHAASVVRLLAEIDLPRGVETFPKQAVLSGKRFGNWLRLPGPYPHGPGYSRFFDGEEWLSEKAAAVYLYRFLAEECKLSPRLDEIENEIRTEAESEALAEIDAESETEIEAESGAESALSDGEILRIISKATNSNKFNALFRGGDWGGEYLSQSEADLALIRIFAFYTQDHDQLDRLFRRSQLFRTPGYAENNARKWETREDYRENTISRAITSLAGAKYGRTRPSGVTCSVFVWEHKKISEKGVVVVCEPRDFGVTPHGNFDQAVEQTLPSRLVSFVRAVEGSDEHGFTMTLPVWLHRCAALEIRERLTRLGHTFEEGGND